MADSAVVSKMEEFAERLRNEFTDITKDNFFFVKVSSNLSYPITITYSNAKKGEWMNGIIHNDAGHMTMMIQTTDYYGSLDNMEFETLIMPRSVKINRKKGSLDQIEKYLVPKLKEAISNAQIIKEEIMEKKKDRIPSIQSLMEGNDGDFGDEIAKINDWFNNKYDESHQFEWDGKTLKVMDGEEQEVETFSREDLVKEIEGFPAKIEESVVTPNHNSIKELNTDIDNFLTHLYDTKDAKAAKDAAAEITKNINF